MDPTEQDMGMTTLTEFLLARIAEDEVAASEATPGPWSPAGESVESETPDGWPAIMHASFEDDGEKNAAHIARHDPARVLAECKAKRGIVERCELVIQAFEDGVMWSNVNRRERSHARRTIHTLASVYADHPDYPADRP